MSIVPDWVEIGESAALSRAAFCWRRDTAPFPGFQKHEESTFFLLEPAQDQIPLRRCLYGQTGPFPEDTMFHTLETTWDKSARSWTTLASFGMQALALSLLLFVPLLTIQGPPKLRWLDSSIFSPPAPAPAAPPGPQHPLRGSEIHDGQVFSPPRIPDTIAPIDDRGIESAPDVSGISVPGGIGQGERGVWRSIGETAALLPPTPTPASTQPLRVSHWAEGNLIYRVKPTYPMLARQARIQGAVELRAVISKSGTIENLAVLRGHAMLVSAAVEAVKQWRYRPYLLNNDPIEVETDITVNFTLSGN
jgi:periplasmic protein TonB